MDGRTDGRVDGLDLWMNGFNLIIYIFSFIFIFIYAFIQFYIYFSHVFISMFIYLFLIFHVQLIYLLFISTGFGPPYTAGFLSLVSKPLLIF